MEIFKNSIEELIFKGSPAEFGVAAQKFFEKLKRTRHPSQKREKDPATGKKKPIKPQAFELSREDEDNYFFSRTFCFAISPDPLLPDANPVRLMIEIPLHSDAQALDQPDQSEVVAHRVPDGKSQLAMSSWTLKGPYADGIPNSAFWWEMLKARLKEEGWFEKPLETPVGDGLRPQTPVASPVKQKGKGGHPPEEIYDWAAEEVGKGRSQRAVYGDVKKKAKAQNKCISYDALKKGIKRRPKK